MQPMCSFIDQTPSRSGVLSVRRIGDYELLEEVARGGMGVIYRARQVSLNRQVALKMIRDSQLAAPNARKRFHLEAEAAAKLHHPNLVPLFEFGDLDGCQFLSMQFIEGRSLAQALRGVPLEPQRVAELIIKLARAIHYAHQRGVLHRDLKPANVLLDVAGEPHITDFGMAKIADRDLGLTQTSDVIGSPNYMAPEQAAGRNDQVTTATDVYSLGAIMFELLTGRPPFRAQTPLETIRKVVDEEPTPAYALYSFVDRELETICLKCLEKAPGQRYGSAIALAEDLERWQRHEPILARRSTTVDRLRKWMRRNPKVAALVILVHLAFLLGLAGVLWQWRRAEASRVALARTNLTLTRTLDHLQWRDINALLDEDHADRAVARLAAQLRQAPHDWRAATYAMSILEQRSFAMPLASLEGERGVFSRVPPAISPDGTHIARALEDHTVRICELLTGKEVFKLPPFPAPVRSIRFSPDGALAAVASNDNSVTLCDATSGRIRARLAGAGRPFREQAFSQDARTLAIAWGSRVELWNTADALVGLSPHTTLELPFAAGRIRLSADGRRLMTWGGTTNPLTLWDTVAGRPIFTSPAEGEVRGAAMDAAARHLAIVSGSFEVTVWDTIAGRRLCVIPSISSPIVEVAMPPDGLRVVLVFHVGIAQAFSVATGLPVSKPMRHLYRIESLDLHPDGRRLLTGSRDYKARVWDLDSGDAIGEPIPHPKTVNFAKFVGGGNRVLLATFDGARSRYVHAWELRSAVQPLRFQPPGARALNAARLSPDGKLVVVGAWTPTRSISVYDDATGGLVFGPASIEGDARGIEFTPDLKRLVVATASGWLYGWSLPDWRPLWSPARQHGVIEPFAMSPNGACVATGSPDRFIRLWDVETGKLLREMNQGARVHGLRFSPAGDRIVAGSAGNRAAVWDTATGALLTDLKGHTASVLCVEFSPDGHRVLTGSYDSTVRIWDANTGRELTPPLRHQGEVSHASFSRDGRKVATAARDGTARIWSALTGRPLSDWMQHQDTVQTVQFDPDGRRLVTRDHGGFRLWDAATGEAVTLHYTSPVAAGMGLDSPTMRDTFSSDGRRIFLGCSMNAASLWDIPDPPPGAPAWFPDFLEAVALLHLEPSGEFLPVPVHRFLKCRLRADSSGSTDPYEAWTRRYLASLLQPAALLR